MTLLRDNAADFAGAIDNAARELQLAVEFVEKDYWVTQVLRALHKHYGGWFVFKGGTSLSKGYNLIDRFPKTSTSSSTRPRTTRPSRARTSCWQAGLLPARVTGSWPSFGKVLKRVEAHRELL